MAIVPKVSDEKRAKKTRYVDEVTYEEVTVHLSEYDLQLTKSFFENPNKEDEISCDLRRDQQTDDNILAIMLLLAKTKYSMDHLPCSNNEVLFSAMCTGNPWPLVVFLQPSKVASEKLVKCLLELTTHKRYNKGEVGFVLAMVQCLPMDKNASYYPITANNAEMAREFIAQIVNKEITSHTSHLSPLEKSKMVLEIMETIGAINNWLLSYITSDMHCR